MGFGSEKDKMEKDVFKMSESELGDYIDEAISSKLKDENLPVIDNSKEASRDFYNHIRGYFRILQLQLNHIKVRADMGNYFMIAMCRAMPKDKSDLIMAEVTKLKDEANRKTMEEIKNAKAQHKE